MPADILNRIVADRRASLADRGPSQGVTLPLGPETDPRTARVAAGLPLVRFPGPVICEMKRRSPSRGDLAAEADPVERAGRYRAAGCDSVSVLTEEDHFSGTLADLIAVKQAFPHLAVLRKDFLLTTEDVHVSWRAGADAVLLIAAILNREELAAMIGEADRLGMAALVEIHDRDELRGVAPLQPPLVGINSRDLRTFRVDLLEPLALAAEIDWPCHLVFESGVFHREDVRLARDGGFSAVLVGESVVRDPARVTSLVDEMGAAGPASRATGIHPASPTDASGFWPWLATCRSARAAASPHRPLVKICGITSVADAMLAVDLGADLLGLIYAESPRTAPERLAAEIRAAGVTVPLVAVVLEKAGGSQTAGAPFDRRRGSAALAASDSSERDRGSAAPATGTVTTANAALLARAQRDLASGAISALQLHGSSAPEEALSFGWPAYKAVRFRSSEAAREQIPTLRTPRFLIDAFHPTAAGGTGHAVPTAVLDAVTDAIAARPHGALWLAGGLNPDTVEEAIVRWRPELIDASSGLESKPGTKDPGLLRRYFERIDAAVRRFAAVPPGTAVPTPDAAGTPEAAAAHPQSKKDGTQ